MSINNTNRAAGPFTGTGVIVPYAFTFKVFQESDVVATYTDLEGVESTWALTTNYTLTLNPDQDVAPGGELTPVLAVPVDALVTLTSAVPGLQPVVLTNAGAFLPEVINTALDRLTILVQQLATKLARAITFPISDGTINTQLPTRARRANTTLGFDSNGDVAVGAVSSVVVSTAMIPVVQAATLGDAQTAFGFSTYFKTLLSAAAATNLRALLGSGAVGDALFVTTTTNAARAALGAGATGSALFLTATSAEARTEIGAQIAGSYAASGANGDITSLSAVTNIAGTPEFPGTPFSSTLDRFNSSALVKTSNTTLADIPGMAWALAASTTYELDLTGIITQTAAGGNKTGVTYSGSITKMYAFHEVWNNGGTSAIATAVATGVGTTGVPSATGTINVFKSKIIITTNGAGTLALQGAQHASNAGATTFDLFSGKLKKLS